MSVTIGDWVFNHAVYDDEVDVLYLSLDGPREGYGEETPTGDILRYDENGDFYGVTLIGVRRRIDSGAPVVLVLPRQERVETSELEPVLA